MAAAFEVFNENRKLRIPARINFFSAVKAGKVAPTTKHEINAME